MYLFLDGEHPNVKQSRLEARAKRDKQERTQRVKAVRTDFKRKPKHNKAFIEASYSSANFD